MPIEFDKQTVRAQRLLPGMFMFLERAEPYRIEKVEHTPNQGVRVTLTGETPVMMGPLDPVVIVA